MTPAEVAEFCGVPESRVRRWLNARRFEFIDLPQGRRVRESVLNAWLDSHSVK